MQAVDIAVLPAAVRQRAQDGPLERVEAALAIGAELTSGADELIGQFVGEARHAGRSWTEIGERLGVSKQAARQRFTHALVTPGPERNPRLLACLATAGREAAAEGAAEIGTHHLLLGLFEEGIAAAILDQLGVRADEARAAAREMFPAAGEPAAQPPPESAEAREAFRRAEALARGAGCGEIATEHLLAVLALDPGSRARRVLARLGASIPAVKKELERHISPGTRRRLSRKAAGAACSFCGKPRTGELRLVAGPGVHICAECIRLCNEILASPPSAR